MHIFLNLGKLVLLRMSLQLWKTGQKLFKDTSCTGYWRQTLKTLAHHGQGNVEALLLSLLVFTIDRMVQKHRFRCLILMLDL